MRKELISQRLDQTAIIPVFYHPSYNYTTEIIKAFYQGGMRVFEYVNRGENALEHFALLMKFVENHCPDMLLGIGSITTVEQARLFIEMGTPFVVAPILDKATGDICHENHCCWIPGCGTLSEMKKAMNFGANRLKLFPADIYGPRFIKAVLGPCPDLKIMPTGGVEPNKDNLSKWFQAGAISVGIGSSLFDKAMIAESRFDKLSQKIAKILSIANELRFSAKT